MNTNQIAQRFANGTECSKWLTIKQASWLFRQFQIEATCYVRSHGRNWARGHFAVNGNTFLWEAYEGKGGSALLKVEKQVPVQADPLREWFRSKGYCFDKLFLDDSPDLIPLMREFSQTR